MRPSIRLLVLAAATVVCGSVARAQVVASTFGPGDSYYQPGGHSLSPTQSIAQKFVYTGGSSFELFQVRLGMLQGAGYTVRFLEGADMNSASELESWTLSSFNPVSGTGIVTFTSVGGVVLNTGSTYWLAASGSWGAWNGNDQGFLGGSVSNNGQPWTDFPGESAAFDVSVRATTVPEPTSSALAVAALMVMAIAMRRASPRRVGNA